MASLLWQRFVTVAFLLLFSSCVFADDVMPDIKANLANNEETKNLPVTIVLNGTQAVLSGQVDKHKDATALISIVAATKGIDDVDASHLIVKGSGPLPITDIIPAKVVGRLLRENVFGDTVKLENFPINVTMSDNIVFLSGTVDNHPELAACINLARGVVGVPRVISMLNIRIVNVRISS